MPSGGKRPRPVESIDRIMGQASIVDQRPNQIPQRWSSSPGASASRRQDSASAGAAAEYLAKTAIRCEIPAQRQRPAEHRLLLPVHPRFAHRLVSVIGPNAIKHETEAETDRGERRIVRIARGRARFSSPHSCVATATLPGFRRPIRARKPDSTRSHLPHLCHFKHNRDISTGQRPLAAGKPRQSLAKWFPRLTLAHKSY